MQTSFAFIHVVGVGGMLIMVIFPIRRVKSNIGIINCKTLMSKWLIIVIVGTGILIEIKETGKSSTMKTNLTASILILVLLSTAGLSAQTVYNINANTKYSSAGIPTKCTNCTIKIADAVTLTIDKPLDLKNVSFTGGSVSKSTILVKDDNVKFSSSGSFSNINANFDNADLTNTGMLTVDNSSFTFTKSAKVSADTSVSLISSSFTFLDDATLVATSGVVSISSGSITIGNGSSSSDAYASFNGAGLNLLDAVSFVTALGKKNYYFNLNPYTAVGQVISTLNNNLNCNGNGISACSAPILRGPAAITAAGISSAAILPVRLESFSAKSSGNTTVLNWITAEEINAELFEIERSNDGVNYTKVGSVPAKGNSSSSSSYSYTDVVKGGSSYSYRLKIVDIDRSSQYSPIVKVSFNNAIGSSVKTYPNPATNFFAIDAVSGTLHVININGAVVKVINGYVANTKVSLNGVVAGNYVVNVIGANGSRQCFKLIVAR